MAVNVETPFIRVEITIGTHGSHKLNRAVSNDELLRFRLQLCLALYLCINIFESGTRIRTERTLTARTKTKMNDEDKSEDDSPQTVRNCHLPYSHTPAYSF